MHNNNLLPYTCTLRSRTLLMPVQMQFCTCYLKMCHKYWTWYITTSLHTVKKSRWHRIMLVLSPRSACQTWHQQNCTSFKFAYIPLGIEHKSNLLEKCWTVQKICWIDFSYVWMYSYDLASSYHLSEAMWEDCHSNTNQARSVRYS